VQRGGPEQAPSPCRRPFQLSSSVRALISAFASAGRISCFQIVHEQTRDQQVSVRLQILVPFVPGSGRWLFGIASHVEYSQSCGGWLYVSNDRVVGAGAAVAQPASPPFRGRPPV
jgi:hypothetical protein